MQRKAYTAKSATSSGPYSHAIDAGDYVFFSGQTAKNTPTAKDLTGDIAAQTKQCFANLLEVMEEAGLSHEDVVKVNVYLTDMNNFNAMNEVYKTYFIEPYPARTCVAVVALPLGAEVEIELIAKRSN
ncbi:Rid family detoxifying hydrolase [Rummeliibacillus sp. G93]|uniref:RidA family protein n=1 Tax=Rummeliibacillus TaxID=648802 RepID=UPI00116C3494|nr:MULTISPECIES: Rid family detoxifying hydrolase [Rummeliibacillus]MBB5169111.1 2-iminobutanoate/2-iminopropanoate deaminase [Rummeliibacillus stabekisii]UQW96137.1 Rid family detoxifying hydrolase [Rummeliibacillus sp. G93]GEL06461.1 reactive intermediate/imine deaminase [Rummeliibacillus stabekisii]